MKAISLWQPWASAIFAGIKQHETRSWKLPPSVVDEEIAIHAAKKDTYEEQYYWKRLVLDSNYAHAGKQFAEIGIQDYRELPRGAIIGTVRFKYCHLTDSCACGTFPDRAWGDYSTGRYLWRIEIVERFKKPVPCVGMQGFFNWDREARAA